MNKFVYTYLTSLHKSAGILGDLSQSASQVGQAAMNSPIGQNVQSGINAVKNSPIGQGIQRVNNDITQTAGQVGSAIKNSPIGQDIIGGVNAVKNSPIGRGALSGLSNPISKFTFSPSMRNDMLTGARFGRNLATAQPGESWSDMASASQPNPYGVLGSKSSLNVSSPNFLLQHAVGEASSIPGSPGLLNTTPSTASNTLKFYNEVRR